MPITLPVLDDRNYEQDVNQALNRDSSDTGFLHTSASGTDAVTMGGQSQGWPLLFNGLSGLG